MDKQECKKYFTRAYRDIKRNNKSLTIENIEYELKKVLDKQSKEFIAYSKIAVSNMLCSGNLEITLADLLAQIDILPKVYSKDDALNIAKKL